jgi:hypothetical protein
MRITITGSSYDLIEIEGDIREEFNVYLRDDERCVLAFSDGTLLDVDYDNDGIWRFNRKVAGSATFSKEEGDVIEDTCDKVALEGDIKWVALAKEWLIRKKEQEQSHD